jgi:hypothetical protein
MGGNPMSEPEKIAALEGALEKEQVTKKVDRETFDPATADRFNTAMQKRVQVEQPAAIEEMNQPSLMEVAKQQANVGQKDPSAALSSIEQSADKVSSRIDEIKQVLESPDVSIKRSYEGLLEDKLTHIDESLRIALDKAGLEYVPSPATEGIPTAIEKFLGFLTRSQNHLESISTEVVNLKKNGKMAHPADLLAVQMKMHFVQQEMELFTNLLNKGLESTKTLLNVQV